MGRATQGVRLINLEKRNDEIGSVCKVTSETEEPNATEEENTESNEIVNSGDLFDNESQNQPNGNTEENEE